MKTKVMGLAGLKIPRAPFLVKKDEDTCRKPVYLHRSFYDKNRRDRERCVSTNVTLSFICTI